MLEISRDIGDFLFALLQVPLDYILSSPWFPSWFAGKSEEEPRESSSSSGRVGSADLASSTCTKTLAEQSSVASRVPNRHHGSIRSVSDNQRSNEHPSADNPANSRASLDRHTSIKSFPPYNEHSSHDPPRYSQTLSRHNGHQIWYPPSSAYLGYEAPISTLELGTASEYHSPEWRTYPAFPSAYPPTPLPASASLPSSITRSGSDRCHVSNSAYPPIPENEQGFGEMLESVHKGCPGFVHSSSNDNKIPPGPNSYEESSDATRQLDEDTLLDDSMCSSEAGLSEDDFGTSLRTPHRPLQAMPSSAYSSVESLTSTLTTTDNNPSSLRTKTSSDSESSGSSSLAGRKRTHGVFQGKARSPFPTSHSRNATLRGKFAPPPIPQDPPQSSTSEDEDESETGGNNGSTGAKRQRVLDPLKRVSTVRPAARGVDNSRKSALSSKNPTVRNRAVTTVPQGTARTRAGSATTVSTIRSRKPIPRQVMRGGPQGVVKSSSTSSSQSGTLRGRAY